MGALRTAWMRAALAAAGALLVASPSPAQFGPREYRYAPEVTTLSGFLEIASVAGGDATYFRLILDSEITVIGDPLNKANGETERVAEVQLVRSVKVAFRAFVGRRVTAQGQLFHASSSHHHAKVLMMVSRIEAAQS